VTVRPQFDAAAERLMAAEIESGRMFASEGLKTAASSSRWSTTTAWC